MMAWRLIKAVLRNAALAVLSLINFGLGAIHAVWQLSVYWLLRRHNRRLLMCSAGMGQSYVCNFLIKAGADVNAKDDKGLSALMISAHNGHSDTCDILIKAGADVNTKDNLQGFSALMISAHNGHSDTCDILIKAGADVNAKGDTGWSALMISAQYGHSDTCDLLIKAWADVNAKDDRGLSALIISAQNGHSDTCDVLIKAWADVNAKEEGARSALMISAHNGHSDTCDILIKAGADVNAKEDRGWSALMISAVNGHCDTCDILIKAGADVNARNDVGISALMISALNGDNDTCDLLIKAGADVNAKNDQGVSAVMMVSAVNGHSGTCDILIKAGADVNARNDVRISALMISALNGDNDTCDLLIKAGADVNARNDFGHSVLIVSALHGHSDTCDLLIKAGADVNARNDKGLSALIVSAQNGHSDTCDLLIKAGADVNARNDKGLSALIVSAQNGHSDICDILIKAGADVNAKEHKGWSALMMSAQNGHSDTCDLLIKAGADVTARNNEGWSVLMVSAQNGHNDTCDLLIKAGADVNARNDHGLSVLRASALNGHSDTCDILIKAGADLNARNDQGHSVLMVSALNGHSDTCDILIKAGADVNAKDDLGVSALMLSALNGNSDTCDLLIKAGADVNAKNDMGVSVLMISALNGHSDTCDLFTKGGADVNARNDQGLSALMISAHNGHTDTCNFLINAGSDVNTTNLRDQTPLLIASENGHTEIAEVLIKAGSVIDTRDKLGASCLDYAVFGGHLDMCKLICDHCPGFLDTVDEYLMNPSDKILQFFSISARQESVTFDPSTLENVDCVRMALILAGHGLVNIRGKRRLPLQNVIDYSIFDKLQHHEGKLVKCVSTLPTYVPRSLPKVSDLARCPGIGDIHALPADMVRDIMKDTGSEVEQSVRRGYPDLEKNDIILCGSAGEHTKVMVLDECDYMITFKIGSDDMKDKEIIDFQDGYKYFKRRTGRGRADDAFQMLTGSKVFHDNFCSELSKGDENTPVGVPYQRSLRPTTDGGHASTEIRIKCEPNIDEKLVVSVDLVPVLHFKDQWSESLIPQTWMMGKEQLKSHGFFLAAKPPHKNSELGKSMREKNQEKQRTQLWRISFPHLETKHISNLEPRVREAYVAAKCLRNPDVCRILVIDADGILHRTDEYVSSYALKTVFLHNVEDFLNRKRSLIEMVRVIYRDLEGCLHDGFLPLFWQHDVNLLGGLKIDTKKALRVARLMRKFVDELYDKEMAEAVAGDGVEPAVQGTSTGSYSKLLERVSQFGYFAFTEKDDEGEGTVQVFQGVERKTKAVDCLLDNTTEEAHVNRTPDDLLATLDENDANMSFVNALEQGNEGGRGDGTSLGDAFTRAISDDYFVNLLWEGALGVENIQLAFNAVQESGFLGEVLHRSMETLRQETHTCRRAINKSLFDDELD